MQDGTRRSDDTHRYDDIINLPHPEPKNHPRMAPADRAAQFSPFAALTGHGAAIRETARRTDARLERTEDELAELDRKFRLLRERFAQRPWVVLRYFVADAKKEGGSYVTRRVRVKKIDEAARLLVTEDGTGIATEDIYDMDLEDTL